MTVTGPADATTIRDPQRPARLLRAEYDALLPILRRTPAKAFDSVTACPGWSVRDVLAHCGAALTRVTTDRLHAFTPELNQIDVAERRDWPLPEVLSELARGYLEAGPVIGAADGRLDVIALGEWLHGGDVRAALGQPPAYASQGFEDACGLLRDWTRRRAIPLIEVRLPDATLVLGVRAPGRAKATLRTGNATMMKLFAGRPVEPADYQLAGATAEELVVF
ncbi:MAG TPA: maleylpyruvate isomerase family mycothiol-dependent enzyme [Streptosporangiaceae bacterium]|nr:maleylpyruvate isomerase family mycothiol-dependent enzyme [Streptosporangiaceae bacterium]